MLNKEINVCDECKERIAKEICELCKKDICNNCRKSFGAELILKNQFQDGVSNQQLSSLSRQSIQSIYPFGTASKVSYGIPQIGGEISFNESPYRYWLCKSCFDKIWVFLSKNTDSRIEFKKKFAEDLSILNKEMIFELKKYLVIKEL